jgi:hypothetical protein
MSRQEFLRFVENRYRATAEFKSSTSFLYVRTSLLPFSDTIPQTDLFPSGVAQKGSRCNSLSAIDKTARELFRLPPRLQGRAYLRAAVRTFLHTSRSKIKSLTSMPGALWPSWDYVHAAYWVALHRSATKPYLLDFPSQICLAVRCALAASADAGIVNSSNSSYRRHSPVCRWTLHASHNAQVILHQIAGTARKCCTDAI